MAMVLYAICAFLAILGGHIADKRYQELKKKVKETKKRLDAAEARLQTLLEKLEEDGK